MIERLAKHRLLILAVLWILSRGLAFWELTRLVLPQGTTWQQPWVVGFLFGLLPGGWRLAALILADLIVCFLCWEFSKLFGGRSASVPNAQKHQSLLAVATYLLLSGLVAPVAPLRTHLHVAALLSFCHFAVLRWSDRRIGAAAFGLLAFLHPLGLLLLPSFLAYVWGREGPARARQALTWALGVAACLYAPIVIWSRGAVLASLAELVTGRVSFEGLYGGLLAGIGRLAAVRIRAVTSGESLLLPAPGSVALGFLSLGAVAAAYLLLHASLGKRLMQTGTPAAEQRMLLLRTQLALILGFIVLSTQFSVVQLLWVAPLCALLVTSLHDSHGQARAMAFGLYGVSAVLGRFFRADLAISDWLPLGLVLGCAALATALLFVVARAPSKEGANRVSPERLGAPWSLWLGRAAVGLWFVWTVVACLSRIEENDILIQLRLGLDILETHRFPYSDPYSALAQFRPFIAHEWLSSVIFALVGQSVGYAGLSVLQMILGGVLMALVYFAIDRRHRQSVIAWPLLAVAAYLVLARIMLRPHVFSMIAEACMILLLEHWRRTRKSLVLLGLIPLTGLWANLHGGYLLAPVLLAGLAIATAVAAVFPGVQRTWAEPRYQLRHAGHLGAVAVGTLLASLVNPYGVDLLRFSIQMILHNDFIKDRVWEWQSPFGVEMGIYSLVVFVVFLIIVWSGLLLTARRWPLLDVTIAVAGTYLAVTARRFVPDFAILCLPLVFRAFDAVARAAFTEHGYRRRPRFELALGALLLASMLAYGYPYDASFSRQVGWGFSRHLLTEEVAYIRRRGLQGVLMNEYVDGAVVIHYLWPKVKPIMDSRIDIYGEELFLEWDKALESPEAFTAFAKKHSVDMALLDGDHLDLISPDDPTWRMEKAFAERALYVRQRATDGRNQASAAR